MIANGVVQSKLSYLITVWGNAQLYLLKALQTQPLIAARTVCGPLSSRWSRFKLLSTVKWLSVRQMIVYFTILQAHKTLLSGKPAVLFGLFDQDIPYQTRGASNGHIRSKRNLTSTKTFAYRAMIWYNRVPEDVKWGSLTLVKCKLKKWVKSNVTIDLIQQ